MVIPEKRRRDSADREDGDPDDRQGLDAYVRFHGGIRGELEPRKIFRVRVSAPDLGGETENEKVRERGMFGNEFYRIF